MTVRRQYIWQEVILKLSRIKESGHKNYIKVQVVGETSVDQGGR